MPILAILVIVGVVLYIALAGDKRGTPKTDLAEEELIGLCLGDRKQAERLIALEMKNAPAIDRREAARRAVRFLQRDK
jgi:hypothetical protein